MNVNKEAKVGWQVAGIVEAPVEEVWEALINLNPGLTASDKTTILSSNSGRTFVTSIGKPGNGNISIEVDLQQRSITTQGEWWYRGVQTVESHPRGSRVVYQVYNIAPGIGWWAAQLVQGPQHAREMGQHLLAGLAQIGENLGCKVELLAN